ncbi:ankyrin repeat-containing protein [Plakobranchus ocellatus]|uniref:Ankyrin repeat-containing protein n=1 Tax=Plakobranchus ocellatus TaxID=259542 RepID=A0AAV3YQL2_9GAST|nr:ankyrin repeat-containing protein [Plakobranchus ocellatus]
MGSISLKGLVMNNRKVVKSKVKEYKSGKLDLQQCSKIRGASSHIHLSRLKTRKSSEEPLAALRCEDLPKVAHLLNLVEPVDIFFETLPEAYRADLKSFAGKWIDSTINLDPETCQTLLRPAIMSGSIESVEVLILTSVTIETAFHLARDTEITSLLMTAIADLEARTINGRTPVLEAAYTGKTSVINVLKKYGAVMAAVDRRDNAALHIMVKKSDKPQEETLRLLDIHCNQNGPTGMSPLVLAAERHNTNVVRILLKLGDDPNIKKGQM